MKRQTLIAIKKRQFDRGFMCGFARALTAFNECFDEPTACGEILYAAGTYRDFSKAGTDPLDLAELRNIRRQSDWK